MALGNRGMRSQALRAMKAYTRALDTGLLSTLILIATACAHTQEAASPAPVAPAAPQGSVASTSSEPASLASAVDAVVNASDRSPEDRELDKGRHPGEFLNFLGLKAGMKVGEISSGGGYTTELLARSVGPNGTVYGQNAKFILDRYAEKPWSERLQKPVMKNVVRVDREFDEPFPPEAKNLDAVVDVLFYHDTVWMKTDRAKMNRAIFDALRPGGIYVIVDHSARQGAGTNEVQTNHRIEESIVRDEIEKAGFKLAATAEFLKNPGDTRDWNASPKSAGQLRGTSDRFVLKFQKP